MDFETLMREVDRRATSDEALERLATAVVIHGEMVAGADQLLDHYVTIAREAGCSWAQIGQVLGVTKQAAQQQAHRPESGGPLAWLRKQAGKRGMWGRFTGRARDAVVESQVVARELGHETIGAEHVLAGLVTDPASLSARILAEVGLDRATAISEIEQRVGRGDETPTGHIPFTPQSKKVLELALRQALSLGHNYIGTEHILLGVLQDGGGVANDILRDRGVTLDETRNAVVRMLSALP